MATAAIKQEAKHTLYENIGGKLELLHRVGIALSAEKNCTRLLEMILLEAKALCNADGGTLYLHKKGALEFAIVRTQSLKIALGGTTGKAISFPPIPLYEPDGSPNKHNVASYAVHAKRSINIKDAYHAEGFDFSGTKEFDKHNGYRSTSFLTIPMINNEGEVIAVLQLINTRDYNNQVSHFSDQDQRTVEALASQAAIALDNKLLYDDQRMLLESFIRLIAEAIDAKSPYTGRHCERVPILTEMLARSACDATEGATRDFQLTEEEWYELRMASWLHDCGKVVTPVHVMDKATKLETIHDRISEIGVRFEILKRDAEIAYYKELAQEGSNQDELASARQKTIATLDEEFALLCASNIGSETIAPEQLAKIRQISKRSVVVGGKKIPLLSPEECQNLTVARGTLTHEERLIINGHMVQTLKMLERLPFPRNLARIPEYACGHHEKMNGTGYPRGLFAGDMSIPARIIAIADVFEALTAGDRPYKKAHPLSTTLRIMGNLKQQNHLDPDLFDLFIKSKVWHTYAERYLKPEQIDEVDINELLAIQPIPFALPPSRVRDQRWQSVLPEYLNQYR